MKKAVVLVSIIVGLSLSGFGQQNDGGLKLNQIQVITSHNSYHLGPDRAILRFLKMLYAFRMIPKDLNPAFIDYAHEHLTVQLVKYRMHGLELDVWNDPAGGRYYKRLGKALVWKRKVSHIEALKKPGFKILHIADVDFNSTNNTFIDALQEIKAWSEANPTHLPMFINVEVKVEAPGDMVHLPGLVKAMPFDSIAALALDAEVKTVFGNDLKGVITPAQLQGNYPSLNAAAQAGNWPLLSDSRGKIVFIIDPCGYACDVYSKGHPSLKDRAMFVFAPPGTPEAAFVIMNDPIAGFDSIKQFVAKGYIVRTQCDEGTVEARKGDYTKMNAAFNSGAQLLSTDYYHADLRAPKHGFTDYHVIFPGNTTVKVDSLAAPDKATLKVGE